MKDEYSAQHQEPEEDLSSGSYPTIEQARVKTVRLVISIPVLIILLVVGSGLVLHQYLDNLADQNQLIIVQANIERAANYTLFLFALISLIAGFIGYILALQIVKPIRDLSRTMKAITHGDFSSKAPAIHLGELGELGQTFNRMVEQLNKLFEERDRQLRKSFEGAHMVINREGTVLQADQAAKRVLGLTIDKLLFKNILTEANIPIIESNPSLLKALAAVIDEGRHGRASNRILPIRNSQMEGPNSQTHYMVSCLPILGDETAESNLLLELRDVSGMNSFYEQIQRADRLAAIGTLATGIAHEIRNPLASIRGMSQLLSEGLDSKSDQDGPNQEYCTRIVKEVDRLEKLIGAVMDFAHTSESPAEKIDIHQLLKEVMESARLKEGEAAESVPLKWDLDPAMPICILQGERIRQALLNLALNAYQQCIAVGKGLIVVQTVYMPVNKQRPICISISNPGEKFSPEIRERLFEPFYTTKPEGTGLGLPIAYQIIVANGGMLEIEWEEGMISFWVRLPRDANAARLGSKIIPRLETALPSEA